jgi:methionyl-tRNA formyltransferase
MRVLFFGTPAFAADVLRHLVLNKVNVVAVISKPDKPQGRNRQLAPVPVKAVAEEFGIPIFQPEKISSVDQIDLLKSFNADLFVVVAYGEILKQHVLDIPKKGCINLHASLLPKYRGAAPIQRAILEGKKETGITIMHMAKKMDAGDIIAIVKTPILPDMTYGELQNKLCEIGSGALLEVISHFEGHKRLPQDESLATFAPKIELEDCEIDWSLDASQIHNLIRGVNPEPGAWCVLDGKRLKIYLSKLHENEVLSPRKVVGTRVGCGKGVLELIEVQLEGKKRMKASDFFRGLLNLKNNEKTDFHL